VLGIIGKSLSPLFFILITRMYGPETMGLFYLGYVIIDVCISLTVSGFNDGILMFTSRFAEYKDKEENFYQIIANGFVVTGIISIFLVVFSRFGGPELLLSKYPQKDLLPCVQYMVFAVPFSVITVTVISATKALLIMKWDAIITGFLSPFLLILYSTIFYFMGLQLKGLVMAYFFTSFSLALFSIYLFTRYFSIKKLIYHIFNFRFFPSLITFAIPQNLNMTFNQVVSNFDVMMLGYFGLKPELIAFYGMGAQIVRNVRQIKLAFSGAYAPIIARLHQKKDYESMNNSFSMVSRWTATIAFPVALIVAFFKDELILLFHKSFTHDTTFMLLLLIPPLLSCTVGLAGNILVMTGNSLWNLINSLSAFGLTLLANYLLIPKFGLMGAASATVIASLIVSSMQLVETYMIVGARILISKIYKPYLAAILSTLTLFILSKITGSYLITKIPVMLIVLVVFAFTMYWLKFEEEDKKLFFSRFHKK